jgi:hypothetical protein
MQVEITSEAVSPEYSREWSENLAWEHAKLLSTHAGLGVGSDEFVELYNHLRERYETCSEHIGFLHNFSAKILQEVMNLGVAVLIPETAKEHEVIQRFEELVACLLSAVCWTYASGSEGWETNQEWRQRFPSERTTTFKIHHANSKKEKDEDNDPANQ